MRLQGSDMNPYLKSARLGRGVTKEQWPAPQAKLAGR